VARDGAAGRLFLAISTWIIQPSSYGSSLMVSGASGSGSFTSTTFPVTGAKISETALVDSTTPKASPFFTWSPRSGSST
jgi:hypothetical protein